ncbi:hypothetical protein [Mesoterricola silvestris]|uniref:hypothetical protein n=1 Tax=Mesoterricola silvestris TaxID=2927979 RepID=UPI00292E3D18|nr:hypothetical protein [Mesoterricola silvestris]
MRIIALLLFVAFFAFSQDIPCRNVKIVREKIIYHVSVDRHSFDLELPDKGEKDFWGISVSKLPGSESAYSVGVWSVLRYSDLKDKAGEYFSVQSWRSEVDGGFKGKVEWEGLGGIGGWGTCKVEKSILKVKLRQLRFAGVDSSLELALMELPVD